MSALERYMEEQAANARMQLNQAQLEDMEPERRTSAFSWEDSPTEADIYQNRDSEVRNSQARYSVKALPPIPVRSPDRAYSRESQRDSKFSNTSNSERLSYPRDDQRNSQFSQASRSTQSTHSSSNSIERLKRGDTKKHMSSSRSSKKLAQMLGNEYQPQTRRKNKLAQLTGHDVTNDSVTSIRPSSRRSFVDREIDNLRRESAYSGSLRRGDSISSTASSVYSRAEDEYGVSPESSPMNSMSDLRNSRRSAKSPTVEQFLPPTFYNRNANNNSPARGSPVRSEYSNHQVERPTVVLKAAKTSSWGKYEMNSPEEQSSSTFHDSAYVEAPMGMSSSYPNVQLRSVFDDVDATPRPESSEWTGAPRPAPAEWSTNTAGSQSNELDLNTPRPQQEAFPQQREFHSVRSYEEALMPRPLSLPPKRPAIPDNRPSSFFDDSSSDDEDLSSSQSRLQQTKNVIGSHLHLRSSSKDTRNSSSSSTTQFFHNVNNNSGPTSSPTTAHRLSSSFVVLDPEQVAARKHVPEKLSNLSKVKGWATGKHPLKSPFPPTEKSGKPKKEKKVKQPYTFEDPLSDTEREANLAAAKARRKEGYNGVHELRRFSSGGESSASELSRTASSHHSSGAKSGGVLKGVKNKMVGGMEKGMEKLTLGRVGGSEEVRAERRRESLRKKIQFVGTVDQSPDGTMTDYI